MNEYIINIDWLSLWCDFSTYEPTQLFTVKKLPYSTRQFSIIEEWYLYNELFATIQRVPNSSILKATDGVIKIANRHLYQSEILPTINYRLDTQGIKVKHISRLDICADFNSFNDYDDPERFIKSFLMGSILHSGKTKFTTSGEHNRSNSFSYLRIGQKSSSVHSYLYNKTKEMKEVKFKHYIYDEWKVNGLDVSKNVWRLEFTLDSQSTKFLDKKTGEYKRLELSDLYSKQMKEQLFSTLLYDYFRFKVNNGTKNKSRMMDCDLLSGVPTDLKVMRIASSNDAGRSDKILVKQLYNFERERRQLSREEIEASKLLQAVMMRSEYLRDYVQKNAPSWEETHYK